MVNVTCRPELHHATTREQYAEFHAGMQELGLERTITRDGKVFHLPTGEYLGVNLPNSLTLLGLKITALAIRITGSLCKLAITPVSNPAEIYISGLEEEVSYGSELGGFASLFAAVPQPKYDGFLGLAALANSTTTLPKPTFIAVRPLQGNKS